MRNLSVAHPTASVFGPVAILPSQLVPRIAHQPGPEMRLLAAVLEDAVNCVVGNSDARTRQRRREFLKAYEWIWEDRSDWPFAFLNVCDVLGLDASAVRARLQSSIDGHTGA